MAAIRIRISEGVVDVVEKGGVRITLRADRVLVEVAREVENTSINLGVDASEWRHLPARQRRSAAVEKARVPTAGLFDDSETRVARQARARDRLEKVEKERRSAADYVERVFRQQDRPLTTTELADLVTDTTEYESQSSNLGNTLRTAMDRDPERFVQLDKYTWGLRDLVPNWKERNLLPNRTVFDEAGDNNDT